MLRTIDLAPDPPAVNQHINGFRLPEQLVEKREHLPVSLRAGASDPQLMEQEVNQRMPASPYTTINFAAINKLLAEEPL